MARGSGRTLADTIISGRSTDIDPASLAQRIGATEIKLPSQSLPWLEPGELLTGATDHAFYANTWSIARPDRFDDA